jgi:hypothetical protein
MFNAKTFLLSAGLALVSLAAMPAAHAANPPCYTVASFQGQWALVATYGANVALALARREVGADGKFTGTFVLNAPTPGSPTGQRTISTGTQVGYFTVNCDGTGTETRTLTSSTGVVTTQVDDFVITKSKLVKGKLIATAYTDAVRVPSALVQGGIFVDRVATRLADPQASNEDH